MQASRHDAWVGLFVLLGGAALLFLALKAGNLLSLNFDATYQVSARFDNIGGLKPNAAVKSAGVVVGRVESIAFDDKTFQARKIRQTMQHPVIGDYVMSGWPVRFSGEPPVVGPAPLLGQHSGDVLADWLKMDNDSIAGLKSAKVIVQ